MNIFEIQEDLQALIDTLEANGGEVDEELLNQFTATNNDFKENVVYSVTNNLTSLHSTNNKSPKSNKASI